MEDALLKQLTDELIKKHKCHTVLLYGSRARGDATDQSDYDILGVRKSGRKYRIAEKREGLYLDIFVIPEKELISVGESQLYMRGGKILFDREGFGQKLLQRLEKLAKSKYKPLPLDEIKTRQVWLHKMLERSLVGDVEGNYRRIWLIEASLYEYFNIRKMRYLGSKKSFAWLMENDRAVYRQFERVLANPLDLKLLKKLVISVSQIEL